MRKTDIRSVLFYIEYNGKFFKNIDDSSGGFDTTDDIKEAMLFTQDEVFKYLLNYPSIKNNIKVYKAVFYNEPQNIVMEIK